MKSISYSDSIDTARKYVLIYSLIIKEHILNYVLVRSILNYSLF